MRVLKGNPKFSERVEGSGAELSNGAAQDLSFGEVRYDRNRGTFLWSSGRELKLRPQSLQVLKVLAGSPGQLVDRETLIAAVWPNLNVGDDSIVQCVGDIRRALGDNDRSIVRTVPKRGYQLVSGRAREPAVTASTEQHNSDVSAVSEQIRYVNSTDGVKIAWTAHGQGMPLLFAPDFGTRGLELERRSQLFGSFLAQLGAVARVVRFDRRGNGLSDRTIENFSIETDVEDMIRVADAAGLEQMLLLAKYGGAAPAIAFAARYPDRVTGIISVTGMPAGHVASGDPERRRRFEVGMSLIEHGWDSADPTFMRMVASRLAPNAPVEIRSEITEFYTSTTSKDNARLQFQHQHNQDVSDLLTTLRAPMLVLHARDCKLTPFDGARLIASLAPDARLVAFDGEDFWPLPDTAAFEQCLGEILRFISENTVAL